MTSFTTPYSFNVQIFLQSSFQFILDALGQHVSENVVMYVYGSEAEGIGSVASRLDPLLWRHISVHGEVVKCYKHQDQKKESNTSVSTELSKYRTKLKGT